LKHSIEYKVGKYQLTINFWFFIIFLLVQTGLNELGFWQLARAQEKQVRLSKLAKQQLIEVKSLKNINSSMVDNFVKIDLQVTLKVHYNLLIENKIQNGNLGYHVLNLVEDNLSGKNLLVNRGWINGTAKRADIPRVDLPLSHWNVKGRIYQINPDILSKDAEIENHGDILRLPVLDTFMLSQLEEHFKLKIEPYLLRLDKNVTDTFEVDWAWISMTPEKHLGYAFQWFALSFAFLMISLFALVKKKTPY